MMKNIVLALLGSALYATLRYNIFQGVAWSDWPVYTLNKAFALTALILLVFSALHKGVADDARRVKYRQTAGIFALLHVIVSLTILSPVYFEKFYTNGRLTLEAGASMLLGALGAAAIIAGAAGSRKEMSVNKAGLAAGVAFIIGLHAACQGFSGWFAPSTWPGMMPPITLISFLLGLAAVALAARTERSH